jgi:hypothetical protein
LKISETCAENASQWNHILSAKIDFMLRDSTTKITHHYVTAVKTTL